MAKSRAPFPHRNMAGIETSTSNSHSESERQTVLAIVHVNRVGLHPAAESKRTALIAAASLGPASEPSSLV